MWHRGIYLILIYVFRAVVLLMLFAALLILSTPLLGINELFYPVRIDSVSIVYSSNKLIQNDTLSPALPLYNPSNTGMQYKEWDVVAKDSITLKGWEVLPEGEIKNLSVLLVHDVNESKLNYIRFAAQLASQGFRVFLFDLRAHGVSGGDYFSYGYTGVTDLMAICDQMLELYSKDMLAIYGNGAGAALAIQLCAYDSRPHMLMINNGFTNLQEHFMQFTQVKWGKISQYIYPVLERQLEKQTGFQVNSLHLDSLIAGLSIPVLVSSNAESSYRLNQAVQLFLAAEKVPEKKFAIVDFSKELNQASVGYQALKQLSTFLNGTMMRQKNKSVKGKRKLAFQ
ncbi:MAG TPA: alpha/beta hydrolase [Bacteroidia bacterium]|nr:alpha/beta hydrolase [Bacteroidia bacterium]HNT79413.1 alpha/beta hydrolase [Bacteroidia bacterium]